LGKLSREKEKAVRNGERSKSELKDYGELVVTQKMG